MRRTGKWRVCGASERGGHRLKAAPARAAWFARERPARAGRRPTVRGPEMRVVPRKVWPFVPSVGTEGFCYALLKRFVQSGKDKRG